MYKKGKSTGISCSLNDYVCGVVKTIKPYIRQIVIKQKGSFINSREVDDILCESLKTDKTLFDGEHRWIEINRSIRVRVVIKTLEDEFGYKMWSGKSKKVLYKPPAFKKASELTN
jgi:hypothetical protein